MGVRDIDLTRALTDHVDVDLRPGKGRKYLRRYADRVPHLLTNDRDNGKIFHDSHSTLNM